MDSLSRQSAAYAAHGVVALLRRLPAEPFWQRRIAELLFYAHLRDLDSAARLQLRRLADDPRVEAHVQFFVRCRLAVLERDRGELAGLFPAGCEYPDWIRAAGDARLVEPLALERWDALLRGRQYAPLHATKREVVLALGKLGPLAGDYFAQRIEESYAAHGEDDRLRVWAIERCAGSDEDWRPCAICDFGAVAVCSASWWRRRIDWATCPACDGRSWVPAHCRPGR
jgi:hypothetical protein